MSTARRSTVAPLVAGAATVVCAVATVVLLVLNGTSPAEWLSGSQANPSILRS